MPLHEMGKDADCCSVLDPKEKTLLIKIHFTEKRVEVRTLFLNQRKRPFRKITMSKSVNN